MQGLCPCMGVQIMQRDSIRPSSRKIWLRSNAKSILLYATLVTLTIARVVTTYLKYNVRH